MESETAKGSDERLPQNPVTPPLDAKPQDVPSSGSSSISSLGFEIDEKVSFDNSSVKPESDAKDTSALPEPFTPPPDIATPTPQTGRSLDQPIVSPYENVATQTKSPPVQTIGTIPGYDPNRIPASIFATKPANTTEWSVTSNESLFSIHMGNNSFSRDYAILYGKSGELPKLEDSNNYVSAAKSNDLSSLPPVLEVPSHEEAGEPSGRLSGVEKKDVNRIPKAGPGANVASQGKEKMVAPEVITANRTDVKKIRPHETGLSPSSTPSTFSGLPMPSPPRLSDESGNSSSSFQFPVLVSDGSKPPSLKVVPENPEKPPLKGHGHKETPKASGRRWSCACFSSCWPRCC